MTRRELITAIGGATLFPLTARAQETGRTYRLGSLQFSAPTVPWHTALFDALRQQGFIIGQNLIRDAHGYGLRADQLAEHASEIVKDQVDVIICAGDQAVRAAQQATQTIPILAIAEDMVGSGFVASLAKPGGNTTGVSILTAELNGKRQEILLEAAPGTRIAALADTNSISPQQLDALQDAARARGVELSIHRVSKEDEIAGALDAAKISGAVALNVLASALLFSARQIILPRVAALNLPAIYQWPAITEEGGLMGYGPYLTQIYGEIWSRQLVQLLRGVKPADIPVEQPIKFELASNLKAAKALGYEIPAGLVLRADKLIE
jgi:putative tryptophan/tyrosine transport system substrate-binding protein